MLNIFHTGLLGTRRLLPNLNLIPHTHATRVIIFADLSDPDGEPTSVEVEVVRLSGGASEGITEGRDKVKARRRRWEERRR